MVSTIRAYIPCGFATYIICRSGLVVPTAGIPYYISPPASFLCKCSVNGKYMCVLWNHIFHFIHPIQFTSSLWL